MIGAWRDGIRRVNRAPALLAGVWALTLLVSVPMAAAMRGMLAQHLGASLAADTAASGVNYDWMQEFSDQAAHRDRHRHADEQRQREDAGKDRGRTVHAPDAVAPRPHRAHMNRLHESRQSCSHTIHLSDHFVAVAGPFG